jgi:predicted Zn-dependent protease with MMP-like domain/curved DNA-binding protein CbpA
MAATTQRDYYGILGVAPAASNDEIRRAFWRLAKLWHPDRYRTAPEHLREQAERRMRLLTEAHATLSDPARRAEYDRTYGGGILGQPARDGVAPGAQPFPMPGGMGIPAYTPAVHAAPATSDPNGMLVFFALTLGLIIFAFIGIAVHSTNPMTGAIALTIALLVASVAVVLLLRHGPVDTFVQAERAAEEHAAARRAARASQTAHTLSDFEELVQEALDNLPPEFAEQMGNMTVFIEDEPSIEVLRRTGTRPGWTLFGLYEGVPLTKQGAFHAGVPERITLFQGPIERHCFFSPARIEHQVRATLLHEMAHHFGIDHDEMPIWVKA